MKSNLFAAMGVAAAAAMLAGCASIQVQHPGIDGVKKVAIVSVTENYKITSVKDKAEEESSLGDLLGTALSKAVSSNVSAEHVQIVTYGEKKIGDVFGSLNGWTVLPHSAVVDSEAYKALFPADTGDKTKNAIMAGLADIATADWIVPEGMQVIPLDEVAPQSMVVVNGERAEAKLLRSLGTLCEKLGADAVVVAEVKLSYQPTLFTNVSGTGLLSGVRGSANPVVELNVVAVNRKGELVLKSNRGWATFEGRGIPMMYKGKVDLKDDKHECAKGYAATIDTAAAGLKEQLSKALEAK